MPRSLRYSYPGGWYHVMNRGAARQQIFKTKKDYENFLSLLHEIYSRWKIEIHAYSLMGNHYHLLVHTPEGNLSEPLQHLNGVYTQRYNSRHGRDGPLFRGRFKSILVEHDTYFLALLRYIHLNPVKAGLVKEAEKHPYTSHQFYLNPGKKPDFLITAEGLRQFGNGKRWNRARMKFHEYVCSSHNHGGEELERLDKKAGRWPSVLGSKGFIQWIKDNLRDGKEIPKTISHHPAKTTDVIHCMKEIYGLNLQQIKALRKTKKENGAYAMSVYLLWQTGSLSQSQIGRLMGGVASTAIAKTLQRFRQKILKEKQLRDKASVLVNNLRLPQRSDSTKVKVKV